jgi:hypothetical protein
MCPSAVSVDVRANLTRVRNTYIQWWQNEYTELHNLSVSQCAQTHCQIVFNTSSLLFSGTIVQEKLLQRDVTEVLCCYLFLGAIGNFSGVVRTTSSGTEVAVFSFNSIYLGPEVEVVVVGQRALSLVSKTTAIINTTIHARPGTLGGFRGGESVAKLQSEYLYDDPQSLYICNLGDYCLNPAKYNNQTILGSELVSNNINGPGSGNLRVIPFVVTTSATVISEVQVITTSAQSGQTLSGGFILHFGAYSTTIIPFDASEAEMKEAIESNLNLASPENYPVLPVRVLEQEGAAGKGTKQHHGNYAVRNGGVVCMRRCWSCEREQNGNWRYSARVHVVGHVHHRHWQYRSNDRDFVLDGTQGQCDGPHGHTGQRIGWLLHADLLELHITTNFCPRISAECAAHFDEHAAGLHGVCGAQRSDQ